MQLSSLSSFSSFSSTYLSQLEHRTWICRHREIAAVQGKKMNIILLWASEAADITSSLDGEKTGLSRTFWNKQHVYSTLLILITHCKNSRWDSEPAMRKVTHVNQLKQLRQQVVRLYHRLQPTVFYPTRWCILCCARQRVTSHMNMHIQRAVGYFTSLLTPPENFFLRRKMSKENLVKQTKAN